MDSGNLGNIIYGFMGKKIAIFWIFVLGVDGVLGRFMKIYHIQFSASAGLIS